MSHKYDFAVFIGRFQIFHAKHEATVRSGLEKAHKVIIILGSHDCARSMRNPFSSAERGNMIIAALKDVDRGRINIAQVSDYFYSDQEWTVAVQEQVRRLAKDSKKICLLGTHKDQTSYYLDLFPQWVRELSNDDATLNATDIRNDFFSGSLAEDDTRINRGVHEYLARWKTEQKDSFDALVKEREYVKQYKDMWSKAPFPVTFTTTDAVVIKSGHVLMIKRGHNPGKGLYALPGGFLEQNLTLLDNALKELKEETSIRVHKDELRKHVKGEKTFDYPQRSDRGRTITTAFLFRLPDTGPLPDVKGGDDADEAMWVPLADVFAMRAQIYEDHFHIINYFYGRV